MQHSHISCLINEGWLGADSKEFKDFSFGVSHKLHAWVQRKSTGNNTVIRTLAEKLQPARFGFTCLNHTEVPREVWAVYSHRTLLFLKTVRLAIMGCLCMHRNACTGGECTWCIDILQLKPSRQKWCKWTFLPSVDKWTGIQCCQNTDKYLKDATEE